MKYLLIVVIFLFSNHIFGKENLVSIKVIGSGKSYEEAKNNALRSALEQVSGVYLSSNTSIINDVIISDNIISITNGTVSKYEIIEKSQMDKIFSMVIIAFVSADNFAKYVSQKTSTNILLDGNLFVTNVKQIELNQKAEAEAIKNIFIIYRSIYSQSFDISLKAEQPVSCTFDYYKGNSFKVTDKFYSVSIKVVCEANKNIKKAQDYLLKNLKAISLDDEKAKEYTRMTGKLAYKWGDMFFMTKNLNKNISYWEDTSAFGGKEYLITKFSILENLVVNDGITGYQFVKPYRSDYQTLSSIEKINKVSTSQNEKRAGKEKKDEWVSRDVECKILYSRNDHSIDNGNALSYSEFVKGDKIILNFQFVYTTEELEKIKKISISKN